LVGATVSYNAFSVLGVNPALGREFHQDEEQVGAGQVAVISYRLWQRRFDADPSIVGRAIRLSGESFTVIGVMPAGFRFPFVNNAEIWRTLGPTLRPGCKRGCYTLQVMARLKPGVTIDRARAELGTIAGRIEQQFPESNKNVGITLVPLHEF